MAGPAPSSRHRVGRAAERGDRQGGGHAQLRVAAQHRYGVGLARPAQPGQHAAGERGVAGAERVQQPDRGGAHRRQVVDVDQDRTPARPLRVAFHHGRHDRVARGDEIAAGHRNTVVADEPRHPGEPGQQRPEGALRGGRQRRDPPDRSAHEHVCCARDGHGPHGRPAEAGEEPLVACLHGRLEPEHARVLGVRAGGVDQRGPDAVRRPVGGVDDQPPALPPTQVHPVGDRAEPDAAEHRAVGAAGHEDDRARVGVALVEVVAREQALLLDEDSVAEPAVGGERRRGVGDLDGERRPAGQARGVTQQHQHVRHRHVSLPPSRARCTPRTPRSPPAGPRHACPSPPAGRRRAG